MKSKRVLAYVAIVDTLALVAFFALFPYAVEDPWLGTFLLATLVALAGATPVRIPALKTSVSATDPFVFTALAHLGPMSACVVAAAGVLGSALGRERDRRPVHLAFNLGNVVFSVGVGAYVYSLVGGIPGGPIDDQIWPLLVATTAYFLVNTGLVSLAIVIDTGRSFFKTWRDSGLWTAVSAYAGLTLSVLLLIVLDWIGPSGLALGIPPCWLLAAFYRTHKERQEEQQRRIAQVEVLNHELEDKVTERTQELEHALTGLESANTKLQTTNDRLIEANRTKSEFLANVSHELRTPLNAIIGFSDLLRDSNFGELNADQAEFVKDIHESGEHLLRLINDILDLSKVEAGKMEVHVESFDVAKVIRDSTAMLRPQAAQKGLRLHVQCGDAVELAELDPGMFRQVLVNLLTNAVKFTPEEGRIDVIAEREDDQLLVHVRDTGIGIAQSDLENIFDEFYQVDGSYSRNYGGTGLGLALVRRMVQMQQGKISVASTPGEGACFTVRYPGCLRNAVVEVAAETVEVAEAAPLTDRGVRRIMVVEDNPVNRKLARNVLRSRGFEVHEATTGEEALEFFQEQTADLVLMDIQLPGMDGLEVTRRLKADPLNAELPIVALTAHAQAADEERAREAGCVGYITKPIRLSLFPKQVESYLS